MEDSHARKSQRVEFFFWVAGQSEMESVECSAGHFTKPKEFVCFLSPTPQVDPIPQIRIPPLQLGTCASGTLTAQLMAQLNVYFRRFRTAHKWQPSPVARGDRNLRGGGRIRYFCLFFVVGWGLLRWTNRWSEQKPGFAVAFAEHQIFLLSSWLVSARFGSHFQKAILHRNHWVNIEISCLSTNCFKIFIFMVFNFNLTLKYKVVKSGFVLGWIENRLFFVLDF